MRYPDVRVGLMLPGEFRRLGPHSGALEALFGLKLFRPIRMVGCSVGAIMAVACAPGTSRNFQLVQEVIMDLKASDIFSVPMQKKASGMLAAGAMAFPVWSHLEPEMPSKKRFLFHSLLTLAGLGLGAWLIRDLFSSNSIFSNAPLRGLLKRTMDFNGIMRSDVEVRIMMTDLQNGDHLCLSTREPLLTLPRLLQAVIASSTVPVYFPATAFDGRLVTDAEVRNDFPIEQLEDLDVIFRLSYSEEPDPYPFISSWGDHFNAMWSITKNQNTRLMRERYEYRRTQDPSLPEVVPILSSHPIPSLVLESFNRRDLTRSIELGREAVSGNRQVIIDALERARERKRLAG